MRRDIESESIYGGQNTCEGTAADENNEGSPLLEEFTDHLVSLYVLFAIAPLTHDGEQYQLHVVLQEKYTAFVAAKDGTKMIATSDRLPELLSLYDI